MKPQKPKPPTKSRHKKPTSKAVINLDDKDIFGNLGSSLPGPSDDALRNSASNYPTQDQGISPSLIHSRETSLALESNRLTPVPRPVEHLELPVPLPPSIVGGTPGNQTNPGNEGRTNDPNLAGQTRHTS